MGSAAQHGVDGEPLLDHHRGAQVLWPNYETPEYSDAQFLQGIAGTLELFHRSALSFQKIAGEATGHPVAVFQRVDQAGYRLPIDERILADTDTLMVFGLDHLPSDQEADPEEVAAIRRGSSAKTPACCSRRTTTSASRATCSNGRWNISTTATTRAAPAALQPVHPLAHEGAGRAGAQHLGLRPALVKGTRDIAPLTAFRDLDTLGLLQNVRRSTSTRTCPTTS